MNDASLIHLIDDDPEVSGLVREFIERIGLACCTYPGAAHFLQAWKRVTEHDIIVMDLMMPVMDGIELMRGLADRGCSQGIVLISGSDEAVLHSAEVLGRARGLNLLGAVAKPINPDALSALLLQHARGVEQVPQQTPDVARQPAEFTLYEIEQAIEAGQMALFFQPQLRIEDGALVGVEALVRWQHPSLGLIAPDRFVPLLERSGGIESLTRHVIGEAVRCQQDWSSRFFPISVSVNISAQDTCSLGLPDQLAELLISHQLDPERLVLEITESSLINEQITSLDMLTRLRLKGVRLSIDDFGTGFSSFLQLYRAPFSELKIDRAFVSKMNHDQEAMTIVEICIQLAHKLHMRTVAEGVEDEASLQVLAQLGCDVAQGYHIARPMPEQQLLEWIERSLPRANAPTPADRGVD